MFRNLNYPSVDFSTGGLPSGSSLISTKQAYRDGFGNLLQEHFVGLEVSTTDKAIN